MITTCVSRAEALEELKFWESLPTGLYSPITLPSSSQSIDMDASDISIGMYFTGDLLSETVEEGHINVMELSALDQALERFQEEIRPGVVT